MTGPDSVFQQIALVLLVSAALGLLAQRLRLPLIVAFIAVGIVVGPGVLGLVAGHGGMDVLADIGIALLLFVVGLKLDLHLIRAIGPSALITAAGQMAGTAVVGVGLALVLGLDVTSALYVAVALTFSSTIVIVKLLSDRREIDELHGKIAVGVLIVQDIVVVAAIIVLSVGSGAAEGGLGPQLVRTALTGIAFMAGIGVLMRWVLTPLLHRLAHSGELLSLFAIAWAVSLAALASVLGFSEEVGAFVAGVSIASTPYRESVAARMTTIRDFLLLFFFIELGVNLDIGLMREQLVPGLALAAFVLVAKPLLVLVMMGLQGFRKRTSFLAAVSLAQISEFSLILVTLGLSLGHIGDDVVGLVTAVGLVTIAVSSYLIGAANGLYQRAERYLDVFERNSPRDRGLQAAASSPPPEAIIFGLGRFGGSINALLRSRGVTTLGVDLDPAVLRGQTDEAANVVYGDAEDPEIAQALPLERARWVISAVPRREAGLALMDGLRRRGFDGHVVVTAHNDLDAEALGAAGATLVLRPFRDAADYAVDAVEALGADDGGPSA
jgi:Kef-type K+ transport system membrane component KefB